MKRAEPVSTKGTGYVGHFLRNAPLAILNSSVPGFANYLVTLLLVFFVSSADAGSYRLLFAYFSMFGILTVQESSKIVVRLVEQHNYAVFRRLIATRAFVTLVALTLVVSGYCLWVAISGGRLTPLVPTVLICAAIFFSLDVYQPLLQANERFGVLVLGELAKYSLSLIVLFCALKVEFGIDYAVAAQLATLAVCNPALFLVHVGRYIGTQASDGQKVVWKPAAGDAMRLSVGAALPASLEYLDKIIISSHFSLEALGNYSLGFSTGRLIYNGLKPALYIYYRRFVTTMPSAKTLWLVFAVFTVLGLFGAVALHVAVEHITFLERYKPALDIAVVIFACYGLQMADSVYTQAYAINKDSTASYLMFANWASSGLCLLLFFVFSSFSEHVATVGIAASFGLNTVRVPLVAWLSRTSRATKPASR